MQPTLHTAPSFSVPSSLVSSRNYPKSTQPVSKDQRFHISATSRPRNDLSRMMDDYKSRRDVIAGKRGDDYARRQAIAARKIEEERAKRRKAVLQEREEERLRIETEERARREKEEEEARLEAGMYIRG